MGEGTTAARSCRNPREGARVAACGGIDLPRENAEEHSQGENDSSAIVNYEDIIVKSHDGIPVITLLPILVPKNLGTGSSLLHFSGSLPERIILEVSCVSFKWNQTKKENSFGFLSH